MKTKSLVLAAAAGSLLLSGCIESARVSSGPVRANAVVAAPAPPPVVVAEPVYVPEPQDAYISVALDSDVVFASGNTYIWFVGPDGHRHRRLYGHGDLRGEVLHRRATLHAVMAHHDGHLPMQQVRAGQPGAHGMPARPMRPPQGGPAHGPQHPQQWHEASRGQPPSHAQAPSHQRPNQAPAPRLQAQGQPHPAQPPHGGVHQAAQPGANGTARADADANYRREHPRT